jgi:hypothetical protein
MFVTASAASLPIDDREKTCRTFSKEHSGRSRIPVMETSHPRPRIFAVQFHKEGTALEMIKLFVFLFFLTLLVLYYRARDGR